MIILTRKQIVEKYGEEVYNTVQTWLHSSSPCDMLVVGDYVFELGKDCYGYVFGTEVAAKSSLIPAYVLYHNFGDRNNYVADIR